MGSFKNKTSLADSLFTKTQQRVLKTLFTNPEKSFYGNEIIRIAEGGVGSVKRELEKLSSAGIVSKLFYGNQIHYQANSMSPIYDELYKIVFKTLGITEVLKKSFASIQGQSFISFVYGSVAKGNDKSSSDIDVMIVHDGQLSYKDVYEATVKVENELGRKINPNLFDLQRLLSEYPKNGFVTKVLNGPKIFITGTEDDLKAVGIDQVII